MNNDSVKQILTGRVSEKVEIRNLLVSTLTSFQKKRIGNCEVRVSSELQICEV
jgi:hypothetical protein